MPRTISVAHCTASIGAPNRKAECAKWQELPPWTNPFKWNSHTANVIVAQLRRIKRLEIFRYVGLSAEPLVGPLRLRDSWRWLDWVIGGGESMQGGQCRQMDLRWAESLVRDCRHLGIACCVKQLGSKPGMTMKSGIWRPRRTEDKKGGAPIEWPRQLQVWLYPTGEREISIR